uniref:Uncharacterized protein n=1 Tax=Lactuca sativa TaxID=4236 RepID=A0A9R1XWV0_LACSA|nr:hypothetical protein LSAT_V11C200074980 [Lactuca sativa]
MVMMHIHANTEEPFTIKSFNWQSWLVTLTCALRGQDETPKSKMERQLLHYQCHTPKSGRRKRSGAEEFMYSITTMHNSNQSTTTTIVFRKLYVLHLCSKHSIHDTKSISLKDMSL